MILLHSHSAREGRRACRSKCARASVPQPKSPYGIKGVGEIGLVPTAPAVAARCGLRTGSAKVTAAFGALSGGGPVLRAGPPDRNETESRQPCAGARVKPGSNPYASASCVPGRPSSCRAGHPVVLLTDCGDSKSSDCNGRAEGQADDELDDRSDQQLLSRSTAKHWRRPSSASPARSRTDSADALFGEWPRGRSVGRRDQPVLLTWALSQSGSTDTVPNATRRRRRPLRQAAEHLERSVPSTAEDKEIVFWRRPFADREHDQTLTDLGGKSPLRRLRAPDGFTPRPRGGRRPEGHISDRVQGGRADGDRQDCRRRTAGTADCGVRPLRRPLRWLTDKLTVLLDDKALVPNERCPVVGQQDSGSADVLSVLDATSAALTTSAMQSMDGAHEG